MSRDPANAWLLRLCDPNGCADVPAVRLDAAGVGRLLRLAAEHAVSGAVLANILRLEADGGRGPMLRPAAGADTEAVRRKIAGARDHWFECGAQSLLLRQRAARIAAALTDAGLRVGIVKGEDFADRLYAPVGLRPFRDIDLMLPREQMGAAAAVMESLGFRGAGCGRHAGAYGEQTWDGPGRPLVRVDLHWNLINSPAQRHRSSLPYEAFPWKADADRSAGMLRTTPAGMLLIAAVHAALGHRFDRLQHLCDIRQICRGAAGPVDVDWLDEAVVRHGVATSVAGALEVTARLLEDDAASDIRRRLAGRRATAVPWRVLVDESTLLDATRPLTKLRRTIVREWMKRAA